MYADLMFMTVTCLSSGVCSDYLIINYDELGRVFDELGRVLII